MNALAIMMLIPSQVARIRTLVLARRRLERGRYEKLVGREAVEREGELVEDAGQVALNVALFPPLFFFAALYYTDVWSTFWVLAAYRFWLEQSLVRRSERFFTSPKVSRALMVGCGLVSLAFRQTNVFWVGVFLAGLEVVRTLKDRDAESGVRVDANLGWEDVLVMSYNQRKLYDVPVGDAALEDYLRTALSLVVGAVTSLSDVIPRLYPYLVILASFAAFVVWNGGVVLGDKSNHIATIHTPQLLYLSAFLTLFSIPLLLRPLSALLPQPLLPTSLRSPFTYRRPRPLIFLACTTIILATIHFNTQIHPFTLADNRHYTFAIFRRLILPPLPRYLLSPIYFLCSYLAIEGLGTPSLSSQPVKALASATKTSTTTGKPVEGVEVQRKTPYQPPADNTTSFLLIWLATSAAQLVTAPLVEPRYFILPWVLWRLNVPAARRNVEGKDAATDGEGAFWGYWARWSLWVETAWFLGFNAVAAWLFLYRPFRWEQEPGVWQRFMW
ncbi:MAG: glucosyltransferase [Vezdaea acicularis]|nr:MAG: glucosyltransferase [Vezdaea acicularis]